MGRWEGRRGEEKGRILEGRGKGENLRQ